jgi:23S rRNA (pseudouridine1915-N3)-methyltransferase
MLRVIAVGRLRDEPEAALFDRYAGRIRPKLALTEVAEVRGVPAEAKRREGAALLALLPERAFVVVLDQDGSLPDSGGLATLVERWLSLGRPVCFLIGGTEGHDAQVLARADYVLSLGPLTWPHFLARAMLAEQLYRARSIASGHPYHRAGRPRSSQ